MYIPLPSDLEELIQRKVEAGEYESATDVVVEALCLLAARDRVLEGEREELRREIQIGIEQCDRVRLRPSIERPSTGSRRGVERGSPRRPNG
jgi:antitoxin ParD1/3/4